MKQKPAIAFDLDDTLHDITGAFLEFHQKTYGHTILFESAPASLAQALGISDEEETGRWDKFFSEPMCLDIRPFEGTRDVLENLKKNHTVILVTNRSKEWIPQAKAWIEKHLNGIFEEIIFVKELSKEISKAEICKKKGIETLVDDEPNNIEPCDKYGVRGVFFDRPWNRNNNPKIERLYQISDLKWIIKL